MTREESCWPARTVSVSGAPPLSVLFGNAEFVELEVDGNGYPIPAGARRGQVGRRDLGAQARPQPEVAKLLAIHC